jgi:hypothetical protein
MFLIDLSHKYYYILSSKAGNGELVQLVAQLSEYGC